MRIQWVFSAHTGGILGVDRADFFFGRVPKAEFSVLCFKQFRPFISMQLEQFNPGYPGFGSGQRGFPGCGHSCGAGGRERGRCSAQRCGEQASPPCRPGRQEPGSGSGQRPRFRWLQGPAESPPPPGLRSRQRWPGAGFSARRAGAGPAGRTPLLLRSPFPFTCFFHSGIADMAIGRRQTKFYPSFLCRKKTQKFVHVRTMIPYIKQKEDSSC